MEVFNTTMGMEPNPALLKGLLRDSIGHILAVQPAAIDTLRRRPDIHRFLPSQAGIFHDLPRPAHDERVFFFHLTLQSGYALEYDTIRANWV